MKLYRKRDANKCGIYCIRNIVNNKVYIGKSKNIYLRMITHIYALNHNSKDDNSHIKSAWLKYGRHNFEYIVLEYLDFDPKLLAERELYWMKAYDSTNPDKGYNMILESIEHREISKETRKLLSEKNKGSNNPNYGNKWSVEQKNRMSKRIKDGIKSGDISINYAALERGRKTRNENFKKNPGLKKTMAKKVSVNLTKHKYCQFDKTTKKLIKVWNSVFDILEANPTYKRHNIYACCSGEKPSMYGYIWAKVLNDDIVQTELKDSE